MSDKHFTEIWGPKDFGETVKAASILGPVAFWGTVEPCPVIDITTRKRIG